MSQTVNEFGFRRQEVVASTVDATHIQASDNGSRTIVLQFDPAIHTDAPNKLYALLDKSLNIPLRIPAGAIIENWTVASNTAIPDNATIFIGYIDSQVSGSAASVALGTRVVSKDSPLTGTVLNISKKVRFEDKLTHDAADALLRLYGEDASSNNKSAGRYTAALDVLHGQSCIGEPHSLIPAAAISTGSIPVGSLTFTVTYSV